MTILFGSVFSGVSIIWDREFGFLREILVAPISRTAIGLGKLLGGATIACHRRSFCSCWRRLSAFSSRRS